MIFFRHANSKRKKKAKIQTQGMLMPKAELFCLEEMLVVACQMNIHSWDALMEMPRHWRRQKSCWKDLKRIPAFFSSYISFSCVCVKEEERKEQPKPILCESVAEKDADSVKDSRFCRSWNYQMMISELTAENCFLLLGWFGSIVLAFALYPTG